MLVASMVFFAISVASLVMGVRAYSRIETARERDRAELRRQTKERRKRALVFVSYRGADRDLAMACAHRLEEQGYDVVKYDPTQLWDDPMERIIRSVTTASAFIYVAGTTSNWIKAELELSKELGLPFFCRAQRG
jgi:TIR domain-containing protein